MFVVFSDIEDSVRCYASKVTSAGFPLCLLGWCDATELLLCQLGRTSENFLTVQQVNVHHVSVMDAFALID